MKEIYFYFLINQYNEAKGIKYPDITSEQYLNELYEWIKERNKIKDNYLRLLQSLDININNMNVAETDKTQFDTITKNLKTTIISLRAKEMEAKNKTIIEGTFAVSRNKPYIATNGEYCPLTVKKIDSRIIDTFITQNPYTQNNIRNWERLNNNGRNSIVVGLYGDIRDKDMKDKLTQLKILKSKLTTPFIEEHEIMDDSYLYVLATDKRKQRKR